MKNQVPYPHCSCISCKAYQLPKSVRRLPHISVLCYPYIYCGANNRGFAYKEEAWHEISTNPYPGLKKAGITPKLGELGSHLTLVQEAA